MRGDLLEALADLDSASNTYGEGYEQGLPETLAFLALCLIERDDLAGADRALVLPDDQERYRSQASFRSYLYALGRLRAARGQLREGLDTLLECGHAAQAWNFLNPAVNLSWRSEAALLVARLGDQHRAAELAAEDYRLARASGAPHALGVGPDQSPDRPGAVRQHEDRLHPPWARVRQARCHRPGPACRLADPSGLSGPGLTPHSPRPGAVARRHPGTAPGRLVRPWTEKFRGGLPTRVPRPAHHHQLQRPTRWP
jgi:hypothetical protein